MRSHPHLSLAEHIDQIRAAMTGLFALHSPDVVTPEVRGACDMAARCHDLGKATAAFQEFIADPENFRGNRDEKRHTSLSLLLMLLFAETQAWDPCTILQLAVVCKGHHSHFPTMEELADLGGGEEAGILRRQCAQIDLVALARETGLCLRAFDLSARPWARARRFFERTAGAAVGSSTLEFAVQRRLLDQFVFSCLLETDKAFLAVPDPQAHLGRPRVILSSDWVEKRIGFPDPTPVNCLRRKARVALAKEMEKGGNARLFSLTAPTGMGKTLLAATWAFRERERALAEGRVIPRIILVLPFLSIIDQTAREYENLLRLGGLDIDGSVFLTSHSLSDRTYREGLDGDAESFFIDTWRSEIVVTTYDQFLYALMSPEARYQMRFHNLQDALILIDEVQSIPCPLWRPLEVILETLASAGSTRILFLSATMPTFAAKARPLLPDHSAFFAAFDRYEIRFKTQSPQTLEEFADSVVGCLPGWVAEGRRVLLTLNTRFSARFVRDRLEKAWPQSLPKAQLLFISADVAPVDRLASIKAIAGGAPCVVVSTQCVEAGVDIDMDLVIRDFAPLDSLVQIAGRCNRNGLQSRGVVECVDLVSGNGRRFSEMIYNSVHLQETRRIVTGSTTVREPGVLTLTEAYFQALSEKRDLGDEHLERFARRKQGVSIRELLRGKDRETIDFVIPALDPGLREAMASVNAIEDRWKRREAWRKLAGRLARVSVSIYPKRGFEPTRVADQEFQRWFLREEYYDSRRGLILPDDRDEGGVCQF